MTIYDIFMINSLSDFLKPTKIKIISFFVFVLGFFYLYYSYGFLDTINTFLIGDPVVYRDTYTISAADAWGLGISLQAGFSFLLIYIVASFLSWVFCKITKQK